MIAGARRVCHVAALDVDGTLIPATLGEELARALGEEGVCRADAVSEFLCVLDEDWRNRSDNLAVARRANWAYAKMLRGVRQRDVETTAIGLCQKLRPQLFPYVDLLIDELQYHGMEIVLVSGSPVEAVRALARELGTATGYGSVMHTVDGVYSGRVSITGGEPGTKRRMLFDHIGERTICHRLSYGLGNAVLDAEILHLVAVPMAFEPAIGLRELALQRSWPIVSRDNALSETSRRITAARDRDSRSCSEPIGTESRREVHGER